MSGTCVMCGKRFVIGERHRNVADCLKAIRRDLEDADVMMRLYARVKGVLLAPRRRR